MKYLVLYIIFVLILYIILKLSCYKDQKNILYNENYINLNSSKSMLPTPVEKFDIHAIPSLDITSKEVLAKKNKFPVISTPTNITLEKFIPLEMFYGGDTLEFDYAKYDPEFVKIENNINISQHISTRQPDFINQNNKNINPNSNIPFLVDTHKITQGDRMQIEFLNMLQE